MLNFLISDDPNWLRRICVFPPLCFNSGLFTDPRGLKVLTHQERIQVNATLHTGCQFPPSERVTILRLFFHSCVEFAEAKRRTAGSLTNQSDVGMSMTSHQNSPGCISPGPHSFIMSQSLKFHWLKFELLDGFVELSHFLSQEYWANPKTSFLFLFLIQPSLEDVVDSIVSPSPNFFRLANFRRIFASRSVCTGKIRTFALCELRRLAYRPVCKDLWSDGSFAVQQTCVEPSKPALFQTVFS